MSRIWNSNLRSTVQLRMYPGCVLANDDLIRFNVILDQVLSSPIESPHEILFSPAKKNLQTSNEMPVKRARSCISKSWTHLHSPLLFRLYHNVLLTILLLFNLFLESHNQLMDNE